MLILIHIIAASILSLSSVAALAAALARFTRVPVARVRHLLGTSAVVTAATGIALVFEGASLAMVCMQMSAVGILAFLSARFYGLRAAQAA